ncbi:MAG TPA: type II toxin-antitoxin system VapC family toxin [Acidimicrobiales bacterium]|nr:type II toxin-antitoxin system VapC family toxin [Acidimicrobiales bacterium]
MSLLLDTHILLWWLSDDPLLPAAARVAISSPDNEVTVSAAAVWEIAIKQAVGTLEAPDDLLEVLTTNDFGTLNITASHAVAAGGLPAHHSDPFDRMMIAQARAEDLILVSVDERFFQYDVQLLPLG